MLLAYRQEQRAAKLREEEEQLLSAMDGLQSESDDEPSGGTLGCVCVCVLTCVVRFCWSFIACVILQKGQTLVLGSALGGSPLGTQCSPLPTAELW